ncbi:ATP-dependent RNA helicase SUPV3L1/SUV3 [Clostridium acetobutylicum]|uniref:RNA helicase n=1 Tax=Clostridium acetobutylicum (strain ATCC 824 / DSM 792 / JCM 1419 / IAM 19013 / LMG 5710 / NBRC 13948 / NRRL B-527 / VKM B-1787 / 2291 / W) TaxID=272562 RepID=Q97KY8_CLOAB|nr:MULTISPECIES: helicase-related protein [Clostridium]AAK78754.1 ATP-dependent RNA helicase, superfamily II [Clostridium acetobutylicum ATCC 824]ADZ19828.1 ATP-dependent RNA helicase, superfamily II [Clostridium acetobutylicum EA 2018]AEI31434.1 ATP-dependent RNA helicase [Clostridium acetobutylicum DSM 1731]AWV80472.1 RNA helicase [Clostridium acetobutylicum]MBC2392663.1 RNA helicase [Clostridium acetobutylicum]
MKKNGAQREFKKLKSQINQIEEIVHHSKPGALIEHESAIRKKLRQLKEFEKEGFRDFDYTYDRYKELLNDTGKRMLEYYNKKNGTNFDFYEVLEENYNAFYNSGLMTVLTKHHIPKLIAKEFEEKFPDNPKNEYIETRRMHRKFYIHLGDTNTGKTYNAVERLKTARRGVYLSPLRILALENFEKLNNEGIICDLLTGEEEILKPDSTHISCTIEKVDLKEHYDIAVIDEIQMISDYQRGIAWSKALLGLKCDEIHICGAINARYILETIIKDCEDEYEIKEYKRAIPLEVEDESFNYKDIKEGDAVVVFSKKRVLEIAQSYSARGIKASIIYGDLPPEVRKLQYEQFIKKETKVLVTTDAIGMGVNLPIRRIIFINIRKFDGEQIRELTSQEVKQISGRAGRIGIYDVGYVASAGDTQDFIKEKLEEEDKSIRRAVIGPSEAILRIKGLPLSEKLALWSTRQEKLDYYTKMDISEYMMILDRIKKYKLSEEVQWDLLKVPFDVSKEELMSTFSGYVVEIFINKQDSIFKPECFRGSLDELEIYYQKINMYYSFSKIFNLEFDEEWVYSERIRVSEDINNILVGM